MAELWVSHTGKVHVRRRRWYVGTKDERPVVADFPIMLCGRRDALNLVPTSYGVTCVTCLSALGTGAAEES